MSDLDYRSDWGRLVRDIADQIETLARKIAQPVVAGHSVCGHTTEQLTGIKRTEMIARARQWTIRRFASHHWDDPVV